MKYNNNLKFSTRKAEQDIAVGTQIYNSTKIKRLGFLQTSNCTKVGIHPINGNISAIGIIGIYEKR